MLTIGKIGKSKEQQEYYEESVAKSREDYYAGTGEAPGEFFGGGAARLGLVGESNMEQLKRLFAGQDPATGEQLRSMKGNVQVHGLDMTFSAPKSVSVAYALGDESLRANIVEAHEWANGQAIEYMERESARVVRGHKATKAERAAGIEDTLTTHRAGGFVGIRFRHRVNRLQDPHLHTHYVVGNWAIGPDGRYTALAAEHIYDHAKSGGAVYQLALRSKLRELEPWIEWGEVENGLADISDELISPELRRTMSRRREEILNAEREMVAQGMHAGPNLRDAMWRQTRNPKDMNADLGQAWSDEIVARSAEWLTPEDLAAYREMPAFEDTQRFDVAAVQAHAFGPNGVTANQNTFERKDVVIEVANNAQQGIGSWLADIDAVVDQVMDSNQVVAVRTDKLREKLTTVELIGHERQMIETAVEGLGVGRAVVDAAAIDEGLLEFYATHANVESLNVQQEGVLHAVVTDGNAISSVEALAGSGKTTTAGAMRDVFEAGGYGAFAAGPTGRAVRELAGAGFDRPRTLSAWEVKFEIMGEREAIRQAFGDPSKAVLLIDETGMADTRLLAKITTTMSDAGVKVVLIGDSYQLTSVRAGGMHAALSQQLGAYELSTVTRQVNALEIDALEQLRHGNPNVYIQFKAQTVDEYLAEWREDFVKRMKREPSLVQLDAMREHHAAGRDEVFGGRPDLEVFVGDDANVEGMTQAVADYMAMRERGLDRQQELALEGQATPFAHARGMHDIALVTRDNTRRKALNELIREQLTERGVLTGHTTMGSYNGEGLEWAVGDRVIARFNHKGYDLDNGTLGTIVELDETGMTLSDDNGNERRFESSDAKDLEYVSEHLEHAYTLTAHGTQGATLRWAGVVGLPSEFSREWAYTALSRAKQLTNVYVVSGHTLAEEERKDYATVMDAETDRDKVLGRLASRMERRDIDEAALLQRAREGVLDIGVDDDLDAAAEAEFKVDVDRYRDAKYRLAGESLARMVGAEEVRGEKLDAYADLLVTRDAVEHAHDSDHMQDALQAAGEWKRFGEMIEGIYADAEETGLDPAQRQSIETLLSVRDEITAEYSDPQTLLNMEAQREATLKQLNIAVRSARGAAIAEHLAAKPEWLTVVGTQPAGRTLRETWHEVTDHLAGSYVDASAERIAERIRATVIEQANPQTSTAEAVQVEEVAAARARARRAYDAYLADPNNGELLLAAVGERSASERIELDSNPRWLTATLGERPADPKLAEQWDEIGRKLIGVRGEHEITSEIDNGWNHADVALRQAIGRHRIQVGLDQQPSIDTDQSFGLGD